MNHLRIFRHINIALVLVLLQFANLFAQNRGLEILKRVEERSMGSKSPRTMQAEMNMIIRNAKGEEKSRQLLLWTKNNPSADDWRLMKFTAPPDIKNLGLLVLADDQMYLYLPEFQRIRRIASHNKRESFVGSDFSYDDLSTSTFSTFFDVALKKEEEQSWILELTRKPEAKKPYRRIILTINKEHDTIEKMELYDDSDQLWKVENQESQQIGSYWIGTKFVMKNVKTGSQTLLELKNVVVDQKLEDDIFTERNLKKPILR